MTVGEMPGDLNPYEASKYVAKERKELSMVFQFSHMTLVRAQKPTPPTPSVTTDQLMLYRTKRTGISGTPEK
jgi:glycosidase